MPRGDRTGPTGRGSMTGRGLGRCMVNGDRNFGPGFDSKGHGRGSLRGFPGKGNGYGHGNGFGYRFQRGALQADTRNMSSMETVDINQQLMTVIDQLTNLLKQAPNSDRPKNEKE